MKAIVYLIVGVISVIESSPVLVISPTEKINEDGSVSYVCMLPYEDEKFPITNRTAYLIVSDSDCLKCTKCTENGSECFQMFQPCPAEEDLNDDEVLLHPSHSTATESTEENTEGSEGTDNTEITESSSQQDTTSSNANATEWVRKPWQG